MGYTQIIRNYCLDNKGKMLEVSQIKDKEFSEIPYKTTLKILNRLEDEQIINAVSKGIYYIGDRVLDEKAIITKYISNEKGMRIG